MNKGVYAGMMASLAIMTLIVFTAGTVMAASEDENTRAMGSSSTQGNVANETNTGMPSQPQTGISGNMQRDVTAQNETNIPRHSRTDVSEGTGNRFQANPGMAAQPNPNMAAQRNPNMAVQPNPNVAVQPNAGIATQPAPGVAAQPGAVVQQPAVAAGQNQGTEALVARVDRPDNCLRVRSAPSSSGNVISCAKMGDKLFLTGVFSDDGRWAQLNNNGWVYYSQIQTSLKPKKHMRSARRSMPSDEYFDVWEVPAGSYYGEPDTYYEGPYSYDYGYSPGYYGGWGYGHRGLGLYGGYGRGFGYGPGIGLGFRF